MIWILALILSCAGEVHATTIKSEPKWSEGNVESVCHVVSGGLSVYGKKFIEYQLPEFCREYKGIGDMALRKFFLQDSSCYKNIASSVCSIQFVDYEAASTCKKTHMLFLDLLETCNNDNSLLSSYANCASYDFGSKTIGDPESFCSNSYLRIDQGSDAQGYPSNSIVKTFEATEKLDCKRIVESYNACIIIAVGKLGYTEHFCRGSGFGAYCQKYPTVIRDPNFKAICENLVIPYIMEMNQQLGHRNDYCNDIHRKYRMFLSAQKADMLLKAKSAQDILSSVQGTSEIINSFKKSIIELQEDNKNLEKESTILLNRLRQLSDQKMAVDHNIKIEYQKLVEKSVEAGSKAKNLELTTKRDKTTDETLDNFSSMRSTIEAVVIPQKKTLDIVREIKRMIDSGGHVSYAQTNGFYPIEKQEIEEERERIRNFIQYVQPFIASYLVEINKIPQSDTIDELQIRNDGKKYSQLSDIYGEQTAILVRYERFGSQSGNPVASAIGAAAKSAAAQARTVFA